MNEEEERWLDEVEEILERKGLTLDNNNDGWIFLFENGWDPQSAVKEMLHD